VKPIGGWKDMTETAELRASDGQGQDLLGDSISISGNTVAIGAEQMARGSGKSVRLPYACEWLDRYDSNRGANAFQANHRQHIRERRSYRRRHGSSGAGLEESCLRFCDAVAGWTNENETAELSPTDALAFDQFGFSVAIRGKTVVVGKPSLTNSGGAYVFVEPPGGWANMTQNAKLSASDGTPNDYFGSCVFTNGNLPLVGAMFATVRSYVAERRRVCFRQTGERLEDHFEVQSKSNC
jgi:hypothetical protein